jgi:hypothetical protein
MSWSSCGCSGASITQLRISLPAAVSALTSSTSSVASLSKMRLDRSLCAMKSLKASPWWHNRRAPKRPDGQMADHLAQRRILAAHAGQIGQTQFVQPQDVLVQARCSVWPSPEAG